MSRGFAGRLRELTREASSGEWMVYSAARGPTEPRDRFGYTINRFPWPAGENEMVMLGGRDVHVGLAVGVLRESDALLIAAMRNALPALLDVVEAARAVEESESVGQPSVDPRALRKLRDALGRLEA